MIRAFKVAVFEGKCDRYMLGISKKDKRNNYKELMDRIHRNNSSLLHELHKNKNAEIFERLTRRNSLEKDILEAILKSKRKGVVEHQEM